MLESYEAAVSQSPPTGLLGLLSARHGHFNLESGYHGGLWLDLEPLFLQPQRLRPWVGELARKLSGHSLDAVCGPLLGGAFLAQLLASLLDLEFYYTERIAPAEPHGLFPVQYRLPAALRGAIAGKAVAIVDDAISAGSAARGTLAELRSCDARPAVVGALLTMGATGLEYFAGQSLPVVSLVQLPYQVWAPPECPLCAAGQPLEVP